MKKFEMPVVVLNEMTMNESIASDCCYRVKVDGYVTEKIVLNGGSIANHTTYQLKPAVESHFGTRANMPAYHYKLLVPKAGTAGSGLVIGPDVNGGKTSSNVLGDIEYSEYNVLDFTGSAGGAVSNILLLDGPSGGITDWANARLVQNGGACDHFGDCAFTSKYEIKNAHIGATMKHLFGGANWGSPHVAQQYNS